MKLYAVASVALLVSAACGQAFVLVAVVLGLMLMAARPARAAEYVLSPDGDDSAAGNREHPWRTVGRANTSLQPGDTAVFLTGEYEGGLSPKRNGTKDAPIVYRSAEPWGARLVPGGEQDLIALTGREHIDISGFRVDGRGRASWGTVRDCRHITISGCRMRRNSKTMLVFGSSQVRLLDNMFSADRLRGDMLHLRNSNELLFEGNSTTRVGHCPLRIHNCFNVAVRANVFRCEWGRNYEFWNCGRLLVERNIVTRARDSGGSADSRAKNLYDDSIFRLNLVFGNLHIPLTSGSYAWTGISAANPDWRGPFCAVNSRFYHNTIADNLGHGWELGGINITSNVFQNNIFYRNDYAGCGSQVLRREGISGDNRFVTNLLRGNEPGATVVRYGDHYWTCKEANENTRTVGDFWSEFHGNIDADPAFVDPENRDYRLSAGSPAIGAGTPLALAMGEGTGRALPVTDGRWFYDGFGIEGEEGDFIAIGTGDTIARVERVELRYYQPAILHLDREVSWQDGMPVSLPWAGEAPDLGALQHEAPHPTHLIALVSPAAVEPGDPVRFSLDTLGKEVETVAWDFEDGTSSDEMEPTHTFEEAGHYGVTVRATFADGRRGVSPVFVHVPERLDPQAPLVEADFEDATMETHWGYQFKFYRGHQTEATHVERPGGPGKCMRIFYNARKDNRTAAQVAPGVWDVDRYPLVRFQYRIPRGVPVSVQLSPFPAPGRPDGFIVAATENLKDRLSDLDGCALMDDGAWHEITLDARRVREVEPGLQYLRQFMFSTPWQDPLPTEEPGLTLEDCEFWFDDFAILAGE